MATQILHDDSRVHAHIIKIEYSLFVSIMYPLKYSMWTSVSYKAFSWRPWTRNSCRIQGGYSSALPKIPHSAARSWTKRLLLLSFDRLHVGASPAQRNWSKINDLLALNPTGTRKILRISAHVSRGKHCIQHRGSNF